MIRTALILTMFAALLGCDSTSSKRLALMGDLDTASMVTLADAIMIAQQEVPDGFAVEVELEIEDDDENEPPAYEVVLYVRAQNQLVEVEVHAFSGEVLEVEIEEDGDDDD